MRSSRRARTASPPRGRKTRSTTLAQDRAENAPDDLAADLRAHRARDALRHRLHDAVVLPAARAGPAEKDVGDCSADASAGLWRLRAGWNARRRSGLILRFRDGPPFELLVGGFAIDLLLVVASDRRCADHALLLGVCKRPEP